jgi:transcriptional regulator with XRE-family HTH domain
MTAPAEETARRRGGGGHPNPVDIHVGSRVRLRRTLLGLSQERLADALGLTFQQVQKYERGANRIGASRLHQLSHILEVPVSFFFEEMGTGPGTTEAGAGTDEQPSGFNHDPMAKRETLELVRAYYRIPDEKVRKRIFEMIKAVATSSERE